MTSLHFASPNGTTLSLTAKIKHSRDSAHRPYRAELDGHSMVRGGSLAKFLADSLTTFKGESVYVALIGGPSDKLDGNFTCLAKAKAATFYSVQRTSPQDLRAIVELPFGEAILFAVTGNKPFSPRESDGIDMDDGFTAGDCELAWAVSYDADSAVVSIVAKDRVPVLRRALEFVATEFESIG